MFEALLIVCFGAFFAGASLASYLLVCSSRVEAKRSGRAYEHDTMVRLLTSKRSHCPNCQKPLAFYELIPVVSYILQLGKCRRCGSPIGFQSVSSEALFGGASVLFTLGALGVDGKLTEIALPIGGLLLLASLLIVFKGLIPRLTVRIKNETVEHKK